ncbi:MAG TPA: O-antigen ligase family protein [Balneolaceae bacterium]
MSTADSNIENKFYHNLLLRPLGLNSQNSSVLWLLLLLGAITFGGLWYFDGSIIAVVGIFYFLGIVVLSFVRPDYSLYILLFSVLIFDQFAIPNFPAFTTRVDYFKNIKEISYIPQINAGVANIIEVHLMFIIMGTFLLLGVKKDFKLRPITVWQPFLLFAACFLFSVLYGVVNGGDFLISLWETRAIFYLFIIYLLIPQLVQTKKQIWVLFWVFITAISFKAFQGIKRFISLGFTTGGHDTLTTHPDPIFMITLFILMLGFFIYKARDSQFLMLILLFLPLALGFYVAQRRAAYASAMVSFATFIVLLPVALRTKFLKMLIPVFIGLVCYTALFWNSESALGRPIEMIKSGFIEPTKQENIQNYYSNLYRDQERYNLARTIVDKPLLGTGFGVKYDMPIELPQINFTLYEYIPHNEIIWIMVKMGIIGFFAFWFFFNAFVAKGVKVLDKLSDPYLKAVTMVVIIAVISQMVVSFYDLQLTYYRNMIYLGALMGLMSTLNRLADEENTESKELVTTQPEGYS